jgi:hypothetical protein
MGSRVWGLGRTKGPRLKPVEAWALVQEPEQVAEIFGKWAEADEKNTSAAKATDHSAGFVPGINPRHTIRTNFYAACQARTLHPMPSLKAGFYALVEGGVAEVEAGGLLVGGGEGG